MFFCATYEDTSIPKIKSCGRLDTGFTKIGVSFVFTEAIAEPVKNKALKAPANNKGRNL